jgi:molecular chaperone Hsp33
MSQDKWIKCISTQGNIRAVAIEATDLVRTLTELHGLRGSGARGLGEAVMGALLISSFCKGGERINLNVQGNGLFKQALVDAYPDGTVRGYVVEREVHQFAAGAKDSPGPWGEGLLSILRTKDGSKEQPYIGTVPLLTGHLAKDLTFYWVQSEQIPSALGLFVGFEGSRVSYAQAFLVQALPGASPEEVKAIERNVSEMEIIERDMKARREPMDILSQILQNSAFVVVEEKPLQFKCNCSWDRVNRALTLVGVAELQAMLAEDESASVRCDFCTKEYKVDATGLQSLIGRAQRK